MRFLCLLFLATLPLSAQDDIPGASDEEEPGVYEIRVGDLSYFGRADAVLGVSLQEFHIGVLVVTEVAVETPSSSLLRLYHTRPLDAGDAVERVPQRLRNAAESGRASARPLEDRVKEATDEMTERPVVIKHYPDTTHAHTIEYAIARRSSLVAFYEQFSQAFADDNLAGQTYNLN